MSSVSARSNDTSDISQYLRGHNNVITWDEMLTAATFGFSAGDYFKGFSCWQEIVLLQQILYFLFVGVVPPLGGSCGPRSLQVCGSRHRALCLHFRYLSSRVELLFLQCVQLRADAHHLIIHHVIVH